MTVLCDSVSAEDAARIRALKWYHAIDVAPGVTTDGWFDLRHALDLMPFPDVRGKRCLDIGTWDGFYAFEMERRGAAEVVALDVEKIADIDFPPAVRGAAGFQAELPSDQARPAGFQLLHEILDSEVQWLAGNIYDLDPAVHGRFDVVVLGSLLVHLRDPVRALDAVRSVTSGTMLSADYVHTAVELTSLGRPRFELRGEGRDFQWWLASSAGLRQMLEVSGFEILETSKPFLLRHGDTYQHVRDRFGRKEKLLQKAAGRLAGGDDHVGHLHRAFLCRPTF